MEGQNNNERHEVGSFGEKNKRPKSGSNCEICKKKFRSRYHLKQHMVVHTGEKNYLCGICKKTYQQKWNLITHMARVHAKEKPFQCTDCNKSFGYSSHFKRHVKTHFVQKMDASQEVKERILNPYKCRHCDKNFDSNYRLDTHVRRHSGNKPFMCDKCGMGFTTKRLITNHLAKHQDKHYKCDKCGRSFAHPAAIEQHMLQIHDIAEIPKEMGAATKSRNYASSSITNNKDLIPCEVCGKSVMRTSMRKHLNVHYRSRVYACRYCKKEFLESGQRMVHERRHTGEKPYKCDVCGKAHSQYGNLLTHRKRCHNRCEKPVVFRNAKYATGPKTTDTDMINSCKIRNEPEVLSSETNIIACPKLPQRNERNGTGTPGGKECTDETLEKYLKIADSWINKKFEESKHTKLSLFERENKEPESKPVDEIHGENVLMSWGCTETSNATDSGVAGREATCGSGSSTDEEILKAKQPKASARHKSTAIQRVRNKINNDIFEKIVEDLQISCTSTKMKETIESIQKNTLAKEKDGLREFLRRTKIIPDNKVVRMDGGKMLWLCWNCDSKFTSRHLLARHLLIHEPEESRPYKCDHCQKTFTQSNNYKEHLMSHNNEKQFYCEKCGNGFRHKSHFNIHLKRHDDGVVSERSKKFQCCYCERRFHTNFHKNEHVRTHTRERPHKCKLCGSQFSALSTLMRHHKTHAKAQYQCQICLKFFKQKSSLKRHENAHTENSNRIFCECGKSFSQRQSLKKHKMICKSRMEPIVKPFTCAFCCKTFLTRSDVKRHEATHDKSKRFQCDLCLLKLKTGETYLRHLRRHTNNTR